MAIFFRFYHLEFILSTTLHKSHNIIGCFYDIMKFIYFYEIYYSHDTNGLEINFLKEC